MNKELKYLFDKRRFGRRPGLAHISALLHELKNPHLHYRTIHVAGTNGKGSTSAILQNILKQTNKTGLNISPHRIRYNERIRLDDKDITDSELSDLIVRLRPLFEKHQTTFFECTTALALQYFFEQEVKNAVIEVGLGGRLDGTNIISPEATVITSIGIDHTKFLGETVAEIAREKAGIIKKNIPVFYGNISGDAFIEIEKVASRNNAPLHKIEPFEIISVDLKEVHFVWRNEPFFVNLSGEHQAHNAVLAAMIAYDIFNISIPQIRKGMKNVRWLGRMEVLSKNPLVLYDVAHNVESVKTMVNTIQEVFPGQKFQGVVALKPKKELKEILQLVFPIIEKMSFEELTEEECPKPDELARIWVKLGGKLMDCQTIESVVNSADLTLPTIIFGSHFLAPMAEFIKNQTVECSDDS